MPGPSRIITFSPTSDGNRTTYVFAPLVKSVVLVTPAVIDGVHWGVSFEMANPSGGYLAIFDTEAEAQALVDEWKSKVE